MSADDQAKLIRGEITAEEYVRRVNAEGYAYFGDEAREWAELTMRAGEEAWAPEEEVLSNPAVQESITKAVGEQAMILLFLRTPPSRWRILVRIIREERARRNGRWVERWMAGEDCCPCCGDTIERDENGLPT